MPILNRFNSPGAMRRPMMQNTTLRRRLFMYGLGLVAGGVRIGFRYRRVLAPFYIAVLLFAVAFALHMRADGWKTALVIAIAVGVAIGVLQFFRTKKGKADWYENVSSGVSWAGGAAWVTVAALPTLGAATPPMPGFLAVWVAGTAGSWWWHLHKQAQKPAPVEVAPKEDPLPPEVEVWVRYVANDQGPLPGALLIGLEYNGNGWGAEIELPRTGALTTSSVLQQTTIERIAKAYGVPTSSVVVEPSLTGEAGRARILVLTTNPLRQVQKFDKPTLDLTTGYITIGVHADGTPAKWRLWVPGSGVCHGMVAGTTGAGKSGLLNTILAEIRDSGVGITLLGDPEDGESLPDWQDNVNCFGGTVPKIRRMLQCAERIMDGRKRRRRGQRWIDDQGRERRGKGYFEPTKDDPAVYVVVDESPDVLADPECARIIAKIGKKGRKWGVAVIIVTQIPSLAELGGDLSIRSMLSSTNIVMFRTSDKLSGQMGIPADLPIDPADLPPFWPDGSSTAGLGYVATAGGRVVPMRAMYVEDPYIWATTGEPAELDADGIVDAGEYYVIWQDLRDEDDDEDEFEMALSPSRSVNGTARVAEVARERRAVTKKTEILSVLRESGAQMHTGVIADRVGVSKATASKTLGRLEVDGLVSRVVTGVWTAVLADATTERVA